MTHWRKNLDTRYISGENLHAELGGLKKEMLVEIIGTKDVPTFDQKLQAEVDKTALYLKDMEGNKIAKPVILNVTKAKQCEVWFESDQVEDWVGRCFTIYCQAHKRHGWVVLLKKGEKTVLTETSSNWTAWLNFVKGGGDPAKVRDGLQVSDELFKKLEDARPKK